MQTYIHVTAARFGLVLLLAALSCAQAEGLKIAWQKNMLTISGDAVPGGSVETWYLEAFCRAGSTAQVWDKTTIPHRTELVSAEESGKKIRLRSFVEPDVQVDHEITAGEDAVEFQVVLTNSGKKASDAHWFQPCMRVGRFTGKTQADYIEKSFIFTRKGLQRLSELPRNEAAIYKGGQVYVPARIPLTDVNPRPISSIQPVNGLIGCVSGDEQSLLAMAWSDTQELFQGVIVCLHNDPRIGGLRPGETKRLKGKIYILANDPAKLLQRYETDFKRAVN